MKWLDKLIAWGSRWLERRHFKRLRAKGVLFEKPEPDSRQWSRNYMASVRRKW